MNQSLIHNAELADVIICSLLLARGREKDI